MGLYVIQSLLCPLGSLLENAKRIEDYGIFTFPRVVEGFFDLFKKLGWVKPMPYGSEVIFAISMAVFLYLRTFHCETLPSSYVKCLNFIFGNNNVKSIKEDIKEENSTILEQ